MMRRVSKKQEERNKEKSRTTLLMQGLFLEIWDSQEDEQGYCYCYETGVAMHGSIFRSNSCCYHHLLPKSKYPEFQLLKSNIVILHPDVHSQVERDISRCPKVNELTKKIKEEL